MVSMKLKFRPSAIEGKEDSSQTLFRYMEKIIAFYWGQGQCRTSETYVNLVDIDSGLMEAYES